MNSPPPDPDPREAARLAALRRYEVLDTPAEAEFDDFTALASRLCGTPIALISLLDESRQWFKSRVGLDVTETARELAFCDHTIRDTGIMEVPDAQLDERFAANPLVTGDPRIRFYAGAPLITPDGHALGTICVIDQQPRELDAKTRDSLMRLSRLVVGQLETRRTAQEVIERETQLRDFFDGTAELIQSVALDGSLIMVNRAWRETLGYSIGEVKQMNIFDVIDPGSRAHCERTMGDLATGRDVGIFETKFRTKQGQVIEVEGRVNLARDGEHAGHTRGIFRDVTERNATRAAQEEDAERWKFFTHATREGVIMHDRGRILDVNPAGIEMFGYTREDMIGQPLSMLVAPESWGVVRDHANSETTANYEVRGHKRDGEVFDVEVSSGPIRFQGKTIRFGCIRDLTDRKKIEALARETRERSLRYKTAILELRDDANEQDSAVFSLANRVVVDAMRVDRASVWMFDESRQYLNCVDEFGPVVGSREKRRSILRHEFPLYFAAIVQEQVLAWDGGEADALARELERLPAAKSRLVVPLRLGTALFGVLTIEMVGEKREWTAEEEDFGVAIAATILLALENSKRRDAEEATRELNRKLEQLVTERTSELRESENHFRAVLNSAHDAIVSANDESRIISWNRGAEEMFGRTAEEAIGQELAIIMPARYRPMHAAGMKRFMADGEAHVVGHTVELHGEREDGTEFPLELSLATWTGPRGRYFTGIIRDITLRKKVENANLRKQRLENIGNLAGGISHDLNNALAPVLMGVDLLRRTAAPSKQVISIIEAMETSARHGSAMIRQLLMFARGVAGERLSVDVAQLVDDLVKITRSTFPRVIKVKQTVQANLPPVVGDPTQLHQVLLNLCVNARDAMPNGGTLNLHVAAMDVEAPPESDDSVKPGKFVCLQVRDSGTGMPPEVVNRIFEPFFSTKDIDQGTGLGLSTVLGIVKSHDGFMEVTSVEGEGTTFSVYLPAGEIAEIERAATATPFAHEGHDRLILLAEDDPTQRLVARVMLESKGYRVITAVDGAEAMVTAAEHQSQLTAVVTDADMPNVNGLAFTRALKRMSPQSNVVVISGHLDEAEMASFKALGVSEILLKPFSEQELLSALARTIG